MKRMKISKEEEERMSKDKTIKNLIEVSEQQRYEPVHTIPDSVYIVWSFKDFDPHGSIELIALSEHQADNYVLGRKGDLFKAGRLDRYEWIVERKSLSTVYGGKSLTVVVHHVAGAAEEYTNMHLYESDVNNGDQEYPEHCGRCGNRIVLSREDGYICRSCDGELFDN